MINNRFYVYVLLDSSKIGNYIYGDYCFSYEPFYIGKGCGNRYKKTIYDKSPIKKNKISDLKRREIEIITSLYISDITNDEAIEYEIDMIKSIGRIDNKTGPLCNATDGGDGRIGSVPSLSTIEKIRKSLLALNLKWNHSEHVIEKMRTEQKGIGNNYYGFKRTDQWKLEHSIKVSGQNHPMYNKSHNIDVLESIKICSNMGKNDIYWEKHRIRSISQNKPVIQYDLDNNIIAEYCSIKNASYITGYSESKISKSCRKVTKNPKPYIWRFKDKESHILSNSFLYKIGDYYDGMQIIKRTKKVCIFSDMTQYHIRDYPILWEKRELYQYI